MEPRDRILLGGMRFEGRHGLTDDERALPQLIEVDLEVSLDLREAGMHDDLTRTVDYGALFEHCRTVVETRSFRLLEAIGEAIASEVLEAQPVDAVRIRIRKPGIPIDGDLDFAGVEVVRMRRPGPAGAQG